MKSIRLILVALLACSSLSCSLLSNTAQAALTKVAELPAHTPPGNIAIAPNGRIFLSVHGFYGPKTKIVELLPDGKTVAYPNAEWASAPVLSEEGVLTQEGLNGVLGLNVDHNGILWMLDGASTEPAPGINARLVAWNTQKEALHRVIYLGFPITRKESFVNDLAIDTKHDAIYITDVASPDTAALIVVDLKTGLARRVLHGSQYTRPENIDMNINHRVITLGGKPARIGVNPISIDNKNEWVYFGAMNGESIYRVKTTDLLNTSLSQSSLESKVQRYGNKPISDGITVDNAGNVYVTSITDGSIGVVKPSGEYQTLYQDEGISWPDGFAVGPNNQIYFTVNELHLSPVLNNGKNATKGKFAVYKFDALAPASTGR
ncbi:L-dopachrome tautomerase-related protein [Alteromonas sp. a30]|uniref:L-dopachrome tautomerase-related protein n=1 Tax=Alteromonas sp. a30 TaxID=2730917 RepID=UPI0022814320|nr:L-dopachrome tautomerase-related protein [Alteromonas sp. a30]MCY7297094.1 hypothetical protein [Alteromonas sp. a30]